MSVIFARDAQVGTEYIDAKSKSQARLVVKEKKENKVLTSLNIPGYGWKPFYVQSEHLLRELGKSEVKKQLAKSSLRSTRKARSNAWRKFQKVNLHHASSWKNSTCVRTIAQGFQ